MYNTFYKRKNLGVIFFFFNLFSDRLSLAFFFLYNAEFHVENHHDLRVDNTLDFADGLHDEVCTGFHRIPAELE